MVDSVVSTKSPGQRPSVVSGQRPSVVSGQRRSVVSITNSASLTFYRLHVGGQISALLAVGSRTYPWSCVVNATLC